MFTARVYRVSIPSCGVALEEEHLAREVMARWNVEEGERRGVVFQALPAWAEGTARADVCLFAVDNYVDPARVEAAVSGGARVLLMLRTHHDEKTTLESELEAIAQLRSRLSGRCTAVDYSSTAQFQTTLRTLLEEIAGE